MIPALGQVCSLDSPLDQGIEDYARGGCRAIEFWLTMLEEYLESHPLEALQTLLEEQGMKPTAASWQGGLLEDRGPAQVAAWELFSKRLEICRQLGIPTIVVACDIAAGIDQRGLEQIRTGLAQIACLAGEHGVRAALEFQARASFGNNLLTAAALVEEVGSPSLGLCLDAFHYWVGPSKRQDLQCLHRENLFHVQLCDLADTPRETATDSCRILPGDGDLPLEEVVERLRQIDYSGYVSLELMNPQIWRVPALQFGEIGMAALRKVLERAELEQPP